MGQGWGRFRVLASAIELRDQIKKKKELHFFTENIPVILFIVMVHSVIRWSKVQLFFVQYQSFWV